MEIMLFFGLIGMFFWVWRIQNNLSQNKGLTELGDLEIWQTLWDLRVISMDAYLLKTGRDTKNQFPAQMDPAVKEALRQGIEPSLIALVRSMSTTDKDKAKEMLVKALEAKTGKNILDKGA